MTEDRKLVISFLLMRQELKHLQGKSEDEMVRFAGKFSSCGARSFAERFIRWSKEPPKTDYDDYRMAHRCLLVLYGDKKIVLTKLKREIGNMAKALAISNVQLMEFFRLFLTEVVNKELRQVEEEVPLNRKRQG